MESVTNDVRFALKDIPDGMRHLDEIEKSSLIQLLRDQLVPTPMGDALVPDRTLYATRDGVVARALEGTLGIQGASYGSWTEKVFDDFFEKSFTGGCYYWFLPTSDGQFEPLFWAPYSAKRRDYIYVYASDWGKRPCGMVSMDGQLSLMSDLDSEFTLVFGSQDRIATFDNAFGGKAQICKDLSSFLAQNEVDFGQGNIYAFMQKYLPKIGGC